LLEAVLGIKIWKSKKNNRQLIHEKLQLAKNSKSTNIAEIIVQQLGLAKHFEELDDKLKKVITVATRIGFENFQAWKCKKNRVREIQIVRQEM